MRILRANCENRPTLASQEKLGLKSCFLKIYNKAFNTVLSDKASYILVNAATFYRND